MKDILRLIFTATLIITVISLISYFFGWFSDAGETAKKEFSASAQLKKYEWFKDASAKLDQKKADIIIYESRLDQLRKDNRGIPRYQWAREDRDQMNTWLVECAGMKVSYNQLASEYNSAMSKFNYSFANKGQLPEGSIEQLPREYKPYIIN